MCNLYSQTKAPEAIRRLFAEVGMPIRFPEGIPNLKAGDICITDPAPIVRAATGEPGAYDLLLRRWSWPGPTRKPIYNFRSEGREFGSGRCLILADGFYEFTAPADPKAKRKHRWRFTLRGAEMFAIAGLWRSNAEVGEAFTMLTTEPGEDVAPYHSRQVVVLAPDQFGSWLDPSIPAGQLIKPLAAGSLAVEQVA